MKIGVTERKKKEVNKLQNEVLDAKFDVDQYEAIVGSLGTKLVNFEAYLTTAESSKDTALRNKTAIDQIVRDVAVLQKTSILAKDKAVLTREAINGVAGQMKIVVNKLIFCAEMVANLSNLIQKRKKANPYISDELVKLITNASATSNAVISASLTALQASYGAVSSSNQIESISALEVKQTDNFLKSLAIPKNKAGIELDKADSITLQRLLDGAYHHAVTVYDKALAAKNEASEDLSSAQSAQDSATIKFNSLSAGLEAAKSAALA
jgi:hypothetical protein